MTIAYKVDGSVSAGAYAVKLVNLNLRLNDGSEIKEYLLPVAVHVENATAVETVRNAFNAFTQDGTLYISGLSAGQPFSVYVITGALLHQGAAAGDKAEIALLSRGVYLVVSGGKTVKVVK